MTEDEARTWVRDRYGVPRETSVAHFCDLVRAESIRQNLIAASTLESIWARHVVDSAQLLDHATSEGSWLDIGAGAGFPGMIVALLTDRAVTLCEPRKRRAAFLDDAATALGIGDRVTVAASKVQALTGRFAVISARAVAALPDLFAAASHNAARNTIWVLPKGRSAREEVASARQAWHGSFHVERSVTDPDALIIVARGVYPR
ncbi:16S rRNA (guanine(527)-N(7))-methyltransferase RsmG [Hephaestia sp. GCM10023244]|uniref:16S rRNA (guanine(527)-N(7))-methyltransferase RsmG n=1 Tax=unclassified Hephaestia TaxID=2631281 RepID=UPI0020774228|nr:RsmG family class I SAM-dependent methyltransferase [Hephaestia sp. MAHUQ-44]MCM8731145.1 16S rRNA (guanine(527)-N(7))-methyltransferase RsmG [Hephaestia sp. MAHUQ-44]